MPSIRSSRFIDNCFVASSIVTYSKIILPQRRMPKGSPLVGGEENEQFSTALRTSKGPSVKYEWTDLVAHINQGINPLSKDVFVIILDFAFRHTGPVFEKCVL